MLQKIITNNKLQAKIITFTKSTHTAEDAASLLNCNLNQIIKSMVVMVKYFDNSKLPFLILVPGDRKLRQSLVRKALINSQKKVKDSKLASFIEVETYTGYKVGSVPPIMNNINIILDENILKQTDVYGGGGSTNALLKISIDELISFTHPIIAHISTEK